MIEPMSFVTSMRDISARIFKGPVSNRCIGPRIFFETPKGLSRPLLIIKYIFK